MDNRPPSDSSPYNPRPQGYPPQPGANQARPAQYPGNNYGAPQGYPQSPQPYGPPPGQYAPYPVQPSKQTSGKAIAALVISLVCVFFWPISILAGPVGFFLGMKGMKESKQPGGKFQGYGLAMAGTIVSSIMFMVSLGIGVLFIALFAFAASADRHGPYDHQPGVQQYEDSRVDSDLKIIEDQLWLYYVENQKSLGPGGPVVSMGDGGLYAEDHPRVTGTLKITDLVQDHHLDRLIGDYSLTIVNEKRAVIRASHGKRELTAEYAGGRSSSIRKVD